MLRWRGRGWREGGKRKEGKRVERKRVERKRSVSHNSPISYHGKEELREWASRYQCRPINGLLLVWSLEGKAKDAFTDWLGDKSLRLSNILRSDETSSTMHLSATICLTIALQWSVLRGSDMEV
ncbi:hypothetical protein Pmani_038541 [Petrolisthes manimaculis]|uniref:Uncharacterized protein n=1 Tax=Petrolisthes manimaculis TaxID=1843537 RepID=A0AAE1TKF3_9EUCA|nr:hypothetical protein Pmani_038541 [Petrolisthes manimaculis]